MSLVLINSKKKKSLYVILGVIIISIVTVTMLLQSVYIYTQTKNKLIDDIISNSKTTISQLTNSISPYIESYAIEEYGKFISNEMEKKDLLAIVIKDYNMGLILGEKSYITGKIRDNKWNVENFDFKNAQHNLKLKNSFIIETKDIFSKTNTKIGTVTIYYTDRFMNEELSKIITSSVITTFIIYLLLTLSLFFVIRYFILKPIFNITNAIKNSDENGIPKELIPQEGSTEVVALSDTMNCMIRSIRDARLVEKELNERFELAMEATRDGLWDWNPITNEVYFAKTWKSMLGYEENEISANLDEWSSRVHPDDLKQVYADITAHLDGDTPYYENIHRVKHKNGNWLWVLDRGKALFDKEHKPYRVIGFHTDITKQKQIEKEIESQTKLASMSEMIGNIAHQWRQPLSIITTFVSSIQLKYDFGEEVSKDYILECTNNVLSQANYLSNTIDDFRNFIKGNQKTNKVSIVSVLNKTLAMVNPSFVNNYITPVINIIDDKEIEGNENELIQSFINIINNSKDAITEKVSNDDDKYIFITTKKMGNNLMVEFKDTGKGINPKIIDKIFEPYFTTKHQSIGTGIGLSMVHNILTQRYKTTLEVTNEEFQYNGNIYKGACFRIIFKD